MNIYIYHYNLQIFFSKRSEVIYTSVRKNGFFYFRNSANRRADDVVEAFVFIVFGSRSE